MFSYKIIAIFVTVLLSNNRLDIKKRQENEKKFPNHKDLTDGSRMYWFEINGRIGWKARYVKIADDQEVTLSFRQEIYDEKGNLVEIHEKYPVDKGHIKLEKQ